MRRLGGMPMGLVATAPRGAWAAFAPRGDGAVIANWAFAMTQAPGGARVYPAQGSGSLSARCHCVSSVSVRCLPRMVCSPTKTCVDHFFLNHPSIAKCTPTERQPHPSLAALATLCVKGWAAITLLQSTVFCVYVNSNRDTELF